MKFLVLVIFGLIFVSGCISQVPKEVKQMQILVKDSTTNLPIKDAQIIFSVFCANPNEDDPTCGGMYDRVNAKTDSSGLFIYNPSDKTPSISNILFFEVGEVDGYYKNTETHSAFDFNNDGVSEAVVKLIPKSVPISPEKAEQVAEADYRVQNLIKSAPILTKRTSSWEGNWIVVFELAPETAIAQIVLTISPQTGKIVDYKEYTQNDLNYMD